MHFFDCLFDVLAKKLWANLILLTSVLADGCFLETVRKNSLFVFSSLLILSSIVSDMALSFHTAINTHWWLDSIFCSTIWSTPTICVLKFVEAAVMLRKKRWLRETCFQFHANVFTGGSFCPLIIAWSDRSITLTMWCYSDRQMIPVLISIYAWFLMLFSHKQIKHNNWVLEPADISKVLLVFLWKFPMKVSVIQNRIINNSLLWCSW